MSSSALLDRPAGRGHDQQRRAAARVETLDLTQASPPTSADASPPCLADARPKAAWRPRSIIPGFGLTLGLTLAWLGLIVMLPLVALFARAASVDPGRFIETVTSERVLAALQLSFGAALAAALANAVFGTLLAWVLVRYRFPGRRLVDSLVDVPFALPTAVAGISLTALYAENGWLGAPLAELGIKVAFTPLGVFVALVFVSLPFVVRSIEPVLQDLSPEIEEAAACLGASRWQTIWRVIVPTLFPALATGFALAFARAVGEYGSVIFIAGNLPGISEIAPLLIVIKLEEYAYGEATAVAAVMLLLSFVLLLAINLLQRWSRSHLERR
ncbi:sulfate ABC transporter permease subunit CysT [Vineibacter terrae]|uniref:Sulfate transport system permease protein CysT n=1 Tax=Vineibacter terrae TaxID=2586908 RepID=A0A5C8PK79_9HYPH|nr:sulfate ABC transporter permease subunit CysT [Vineibacter terrae]